MLLEVIVQSVDDALAATDGGADRLEVVRDIAQGGLTPALSLVRRIAQATPLPLRVMVRENGGFTLLPSEVETCRRAAAELAALGVDGLVVGFADEGRPRLDDVRRVIDAAAGAAVTFHRAFDRLDDPLAAIAPIAAIPQVDRILTSGGEGPAGQRAARLQGFQSRAGRVAIVAGGGIDAPLIARLAADGAIREVHVGRAARVNDRPDGAVSAAKVRALRRLAGPGPDVRVTTP